MNQRTQAALWNMVMGLITGFFIAAALYTNGCTN